MKDDEVIVRIEALLPTPQGVGVFLGDGNKVIAIFVDAMVLAVRHRCPIHVARAVWEQAADMRWALEQAQEQSNAEENPEHEDRPPDHDAQNEDEPS